MSKLTSPEKNITTQSAAVKKRRRPGAVKGVERNSILDKLKESEEKFSKAFRASPDAMSISTLDDGRFIEINESHTRLYGYTREELLNGNAGDFNMWATPEDRKKMLEPILRHETLHNLEVDVRNKNGAINTMLVSTEFVQISGRQCLLVVSTDITEYKRTKKALNESEQQLAKIFRLSPQQIIISRLQDGKIIDVNEQFARIYGFTREEIIGRTAIAINLLSKPEDRQRMLEMVRKYGRVYNEVFEFRTKSGEILTELYSAEPVELNGEECLIGIITDITNLKQMENAQKESEEKFSKAFHAIPERITISRIRDGMILDVNDSFLRNRKRTREETIGRTVQEIGLWAKPGARDSIIRDIQENGRIVNRELTYTTGDGEIETTLFSADIISIGGEPCMISITNDITGRKRIEQALSDSEQKFFKTFHAIPESISISRVSDGVFVEVNKSFCRQRKLTHEEIIGHTSKELGLWEAPGEREKMIREIQEKGAAINREYTIGLGSGEKQTSLISADIVEISGVPNLIVISKDITDRKQMERALRASEERFSKAFHAIPEAISISSVATGQFLDVNEIFCRLIGFPHEQIIGKTSNQLGIGAKLANRALTIKMIKEQGKIISKEIEYKTNTGETVTTLFSADIIDIGGEPCLISMSTDITRRKQMENALKASEEKFSKAFKSIPESITVSRVKDGVFLEANDNFCRVIGRTRDEVIGHASAEIGVINVPGQRAEIIKTIQTQGGIINREINTDLGNGKIRTTLFSADIIDINGEPCMISISTDITERKHMEEALANEEIRRRILIEQSNDGIVTVDETGKVYETNRRFAEMIGYSIEETKNLHIWDWEYQISRERVKEMLRTVDQSGDHFETKHRRKDGSIYDVEISTNGAMVAGNKLVFCVCRDITQRKRMEEALKASEEKFSKAFRYIPESIAISRVSDGIILDVNDNFCHLANRSHDEIVGHTDRNLHFAQLPGNRDEDIKTIREKSGIKNREMLYNAGTDKMRAALFSADIIDIGGEPCVLSISTDITERKRMEQSLADEAVRRRVLFDQSRDGIVTIDQSGAVNEANRRFAEMHGYTPEEVLKLHIWDWEISLPKEKLLENIEMRDDKGANFEARHRRKDGSVFDVEVSSNGTDYAGQKLVFSVIRDISERKGMEQALRESEEKFSKAFRSSPEIMGIINLRTGLYMDINDSFVNTTGYSREELIGHPAVEINMFVDQHEYESMSKVLQEKGTFQNLEISFRMKSGEVRQWLCSSEAVTLGGDPCNLSVAIDITDRKRMEVTLRESEEKFSKAFHAIPEAVSISTVKGDIFLDVNEGFLRAIGLPREQVIGHSSNELNFWNNSEEHKAMVRSVIENGSIVNQEREFVTESGEKTTLLFSSNIIHLAGEPCIIIITNNITARKQAEEQLKKALAELQSSTARLKATNKELESFSYSISHDLRSPLRSIDGFSQALLEDYAPKLDETARDYLNRMRTASQKMGELIDGLLKLSRLTRNDMHYEAVDLSALAQDIATRLQETDPERKAEFIITPGLKAAGDAQMLRVMLENLVGNAWKFTSKVPQARIEFGSSVSGGEETFFIRDNGAGFDMAYRDKLFGAFQRLHDTQDFPGTGIGLATVQRIINRHGGTIRAEGVVNQGAVFYFTL